MADNEEVSMAVRVPLSRIEAEVRDRHSISIPMASATLEEGFLVFRFGSDSRGDHVATETEGGPIQHLPAGSPKSPLVVQSNSTGQDAHFRMPLRTRRKSKRNRMRTRGWGIVAKIVNSRGQTATVYEPFVEALRLGGLSRKDQEAAVVRVLKQNGNKPGRVSIDYYLSNTLEYLAKEAQR